MTSLPDGYDTGATPGAGAPGRSGHTTGPDREDER
jgi:hypothetical protein